MEKYTAIKERVVKYKNMLNQVAQWRSTWSKELKTFILTEVTKLLEATGLEATVNEEEKIKGLESITIMLGNKKSGIYEMAGDGNERKDFFKEYGTLVYSQLFNGKVQVWMTYPFIEGLIEPRPPKLIGIYAPPEFNEALIIGHVETFLKDLIEWEDFDDDDNPNAAPPKTQIGFAINSGPEE
jgi:hypothetical protein